MATDVLMLHGVGLDHSMWSRVRSALPPGFNVTAPDLLGHGRSAAAPPGCSLRDLSLHPMKQVASPVHIVGFSLGALVGQYLALHQPEKVLSLTCVSTVIARSAEQRASVLRRHERAEADFEGSIEDALERWFPVRELVDPSMREETRQTLLANDRMSYLRAYAVFTTADRELYKDLADINVPVLAVTGSLDTGSTPEMSENLAATVRNGSAHIVSGVRHMLPLQRAAELARLVKRFIDGQTHG